MFKLLPFLITFFSSQVINIYSQEIPIKWGEIPIADLQMTSFPADSNASAVILCDFGESKLNDQLGIEYNRYLRVKILNEKGYIFAQVPNYKGISNRLKSFINRIGFNKNDYGHFGFPYHLYSFDKKSLSSLFQRSGFNIVHFEAWSHLLKENQHGLLNDFIISLTKKFCISDYIIAVGEKI